MKVKDEQLKIIAKPIYYAIMESLKDPDNYKKYEEWKKQKNKQKERALAS